MRSSWLPPVLESVEVGDHLGHVVVKLLQHVSGPTVPLRVLLEGAVRARVVRRDGLVEQSHLCKKQGGNNGTLISEGYYTVQLRLMGR